MKGYIIIIFILGLGALTSYWGITSDNMARTFAEGQVSGMLVRATSPVKQSSHQHNDDTTRLRDLRDASLPEEISDPTEKSNLRSYQVHDLLLRRK